MTDPHPPSPTAADLRAAFDGPQALTLGLEEEVMLLCPDTLDLTPRAAEVMKALDGDPRFKLELPAAQLEIVTPPVDRVGDAVEVLTRGRERLAAIAGSLAKPACAGVHPFAAIEGPLNSGARYDHIEAEYGSVARRQLVCGLQVHVAVRGADRALAVYNGLRGHLPELAALAANGPFHAGRDTGLASARPLISGMLPRQGVPPALRSWEHFAEELRWGAQAGALPEPRLWWWEVRPHPTYGTLEVRVPDAQTTVTDAAAVAAVVHALAAWLADRHDAGEVLPRPPTWRIAENRWRACRHGLEAPLADLSTGEPQTARRRVGALLDQLEASALQIGCREELDSARRLVEVNGAERQRAVAAEVGLPGLAAWLARQFLPQA
ncbi:MAG: YbdK family carboxylate-amine ligase [Actinomycetota bacterium]|nr:YbdK family carboxylate-amine ligase [Actinomycetota bacterium]